MAKFKIHGSSGEGRGAGWIGKVYFDRADMTYETNDAEMINMLRKSGMATEIIEAEKIKSEADTDDPLASLYDKSRDELVEICKEMQIEPKRAKQDMIDAIIAELKDSSQISSK